MSLLDDARRLAELEPIHDTDYGLECMHCGATSRLAACQHAPDCPWLAMPKIVAALEEAATMRDDYKRLRVGVRSLEYALNASGEWTHEHQARALLDSTPSIDDSDDGDPP